MSNDTTTSDYVYLPDYDGEWSVMSRSEYDETGSAATYGPAQPAELVISLEGHRGHYLTADFILEAWDLLPDIVNSGESVPLQDARASALVYHEHQGIFSGTPACEPMCAACEFIHDDADRVENILSDHGYVTEWGDGVSVYRVGGAS